MIRQKEQPKNYIDEGYFLVNISNNLEKEKYSHLHLCVNGIELYETYNQLFHLAFYVEKYGKSTIAFPQTPYRILGNDVFHQDKKVDFNIISESLASDENGNTIFLGSKKNLSQFRCIDKETIEQIFLKPSTSFADELKKILASESILIATNLILDTMNVKQDYANIPIIKENLKAIKYFFSLMKEEKITTFLDFSYSLSEKESFYNDCFCSRVSGEIKRLEKVFKKGFRTK